MIKPFYTSIAARATNEVHAANKLKRLQSLLTTWNALCSFKVKNLEQLQEIAKDPVGYYITRHWEKNRVPRGVEAPPVKLPDCFREIERLAAELQADSLTSFALEGETVTLSNDYYRRLVNKVYFFAVTPAQKKRLAYAQELVKLIAKQKDFLDEELAEYGLTYNFPHQWSAVPTGVKFTFVDGVKTVVVDEEWVVRGYCETSSLLLRDAFKRANVTPTGDFRIAKAEDGSIILLEEKYSTLFMPKGYEGISGRYELMGSHLKKKEKNFTQEIHEQIKPTIQSA